MKFKQSSAVVVSTRSAALISNAMDQKKMSIKDLAVALDITYEHARRMTRGESIPSKKFMLKGICEVLALDLGEMEKLVTADKIQQTYGSIPAEISGKKPGLDAIERVWDNLSQEQQQDATALVVAWAERNRLRSDHTAE